MKNIILKIFITFMITWSYNIYSQSDIISFEAYNKGVSYLNAGNYDSAIVHFNESLDVKADLASAYYNLSISYFGLKEYQKALECIDKYEVYNHVNNNYYLKGLCYEYLNDRDTAIILYNKAVEDNVEADEALAKLSSIYYEKQEYDSALNCCSYFVFRNPLNAKGYYNKGTIYLYLNRVQEAKSEFLTALKFAENDDMIMTQLGYSYYMLDMYNDALDILNKAVTHNPENIIAYNLIGLTYVKLFNYISALKAFSAGIAVDEKATELYNNRGITLFKLESYQKALADFNHVLSLNPNDSRALFNRANVKDRLYDPNGACEDLNKAFELGELKAEPLLKFCNR